MSRSLAFCVLAMGLTLSAAGHGEKKAAASKTKKEVSKMVSVTMSTSLGEIELELNHEKAPKTVDNFLSYVDKKFYDGTIFHRVIPTFMIQGGGFTEKMEQKKTGPTIENEATNGLSNAKGTIAMARLPEPHSASAQFFINVENNEGLDHKGKSDSEFGYAVFGKVTNGMDVVEKIKRVSTTTVDQYQNVPKEPVVIKSIRRK